jgi:general nucleoside transport system permease protein
MEVGINLFNAAVLAGTPLLLGMLGEILTEKSGNLNLGVEGMMFMGAAFGLVGAWTYEQWALTSGIAVSGAMGVFAAVFAAAAAGALGALIYSFLTISLRANQNVTGLTLTIFGTGFANLIGELLGKKAGGFVMVGPEIKAAFSNVGFGGLSQIPVLGKLLFSYNWMVYFGIGLAIAMAWFFNKTRVGLKLRAVGESPATADAAGINVTRYKYVATVVGGAICGIGGMYMVMVTCSGVWVHNSVSGYGWLAVALVIFATWNPLRGLLAGLIFGAFTIMRLYIPIPGLSMHLYNMLPYAATIVVLIITSISQSKEHAMPKSCGVNYFREER